VVARPDGETVAARPTWMRNLETWRAAVSGLALLAGWGMELFARPGPLTILLFAAATLVGGYATICRGLRALSRFQFDMNVMMTGAVTGAALIGQWEEGAAVAFLYAVSNLLEATTLDRARRTIRGLMDLAPREGRIRRGGQELVVPVEDVRVGDLLLVRPGEKIAADGIVRAGVSHVALLSGDNAAVAGSIARAIGADEVRAPLLPEDKLTAVRDLRERYGDLVMVGDGVNDAPALAAATVGVAMGVAGSDVALKTADVALMSDDLGKLPFVMGLGRATVRVIQQNTAFALAIKALAILAVFPGWLTLWLAVLGDMGASVLVTLNGMRLLALRPSTDRGGGR